MAAPETVPREALADAARRSFELAARLDWKSHDPFDLLLSPLGPKLQSLSWFGARVLVQIGKRSGAGVRRVLGVPVHEEAKALADLLRAAVLLAASGEEWAQRYPDDLSQRLRLRSTSFPDGRGWGLDFPYASRFVNVERGKPNIYITTAACQALLDHHQSTGDAAALEAALDGTGFILDGLGWFELNGKSWLRYWRDLDTPTINVQASAASLLARAGAVAGEERLSGAADRAAATVLATQRPDGSWPYTEDGRATFVDGFHTGFTLQGLHEYAGLRGTDAVPGALEAVARGLAYFREHLLSPEGLPLGFADGKVSLDGQNVAQCLQTLVVCDPASTGEASRLWQAGIEGMLSSGEAAGSPALRWTIAPAVLATAYLLRGEGPA